jgi:Family of unknown function (DUF6655)
MSMRPESTRLMISRHLAIVLSAMLTGGCTSVKTTGSARSGSEQLLLTGAWDSALCTVDFRPLAGRRAFLDPQFVTVVDKEWVLSSTRRAMAEQGVLLQDVKDKADVIVEAALGAYGTDDRNCTVGLPQVGILPSLSGTVAASGSSPGPGSNTSSASSLSLSQTSKQDAVVKASFFAYEAKSGQMVWESGPILNAQGVRDHYVLGAGPHRISSLPELDRYPEEAQERTRRRFWRRLTGR